MSKKPVFIESPAALTEQLLQSRLALGNAGRLVAAIVGAPGSGKSTLAEELAERLDQSLAGSDEAAIVVPMDGFHLDNVLLDKHGTRAVKGSPQTFDVGGVCSLVRRLCASERTVPKAQLQSDTTIYAPVFDRAADLARNAALAVEARHSIVLVEGNYLLLGRPGWRELHELFDLSIMLDVPENILEQRLIQRWLDHGLAPDAARQRATANDIPNARVVLEESAAAHLYYKSVRQ